MREKERGKNGFLFEPEKYFTCYYIPVFRFKGLGHAFYHIFIHFGNNDLSVKINTILMSYPINTSNSNIINHYWNIMDCSMVKIVLFFHSSSSEKITIRCHMERKSNREKELQFQMYSYVMISATS